MFLYFIDIFFYIFVHNFNWFDISFTALTLGNEGIDSAIRTAASIHMILELRIILLLLGIVMYTARSVDTFGAFNSRQAAIIFGIFLIFNARFFL